MSRDFFSLAVFRGQTGSPTCPPNALRRHAQNHADKLRERARHLMQQDGLAQDQVAQVRGFADQSLRKKDSPLDPSNRRITLIVQYIVKNADEDSPRPVSSAEHEKPSAGQPDEQSIGH